MAEPGFGSDRNLEQTWTFPATTAAIGDARDVVRSWLTTRGCAAGTVDDLELVCSELVSNAIQHADGVSSLSVTLDDRCAGLSVRHRGDPSDIPPPQDWGPAEPEALSGRGLGIVAALADEIRVHHHADLVTIEARRLLGNGAGPVAPS
jgi:anti-sigma regulatory factor (Ser/Thr protein kinase)